MNSHPALLPVARALVALSLLFCLTACPMDSLLHPDLPRFTELPAFDPHRKEFECKHEAEANPPIGTEAQQLFEEALALDHWELWYDQIDHKAMAKLYAQAMKLGHWKAQLNLAQMYLEGRGVEFNPDEALRLTEDLMRQGVPAAWHRMGSLYMMGAGPLRQDATVAYAFWQRAAEMGSMESQAFLGEKLSANHDEPPTFWGNWPIGKKMMECSLAQGFGRASYDLGVMLDVKAQTPEDYRNALAIFQQGVRLGCQECARYLGSAFRLGSPMIGRAKDPSRGERYWHISERLRMDHHLKLPNLDRVLPLPPAPLPHWNSDPDTLIDAAKGVRVTPRPESTSAHRLPPEHRAHIPPGHTLQLPAGRAHLARRPAMPGLGNILAEGPFTPGMARAPVEGYWQARALPPHPSDEPYTLHLRREFANLLPMRFREGERMQLTMGDSNLLYDESVHGLVEWHFVGEAVPQRLYARAMKLGHWKAQLNLAQMYLEGRGVEFNPDEALRLTEDLMRQGVPAAWHRMGSLYMMGAGPLRQDATVAYAFWQRAAEIGSMESQAFLGEKLDADHDSPPNYWGNEVIGLKMLECSFAQGSGEAAYRLGLSLNHSARTAQRPEAYRRAQEVMHEGVKRGCKACASYLSASFDGGSSIVGRAKDPSRHERYFAIAERLRRDHQLKLPNLDRVLPLPPAPLPHWNSDPDTLIDAAKGVRGPAHQLRDEFHAPPPARPLRSSA